MARCFLTACFTAPVFIFPVTRCILRCILCPFDYYKSRCIRPKNMRLLYEPTGRKSDEGIEVTYRIANLYDLLAIVLGEEHAHKID